MKIFILMKYFIHLYLTCFLFKYSIALKWNNFMEDAMWGTGEISNVLKPYFVDNFPTSNVSEQCISSLIMYADGIKNFKPWAVKMLDATGKPPSSFLQGTHLDFGLFDECLSVEVDTKRDSDFFKGQFCMLSLTHPLIPSKRMAKEFRKTYIETHGNPPEWVRETTHILEWDWHRFLGLYLGICTPSSCTERDLLIILSTYAKPLEMQVSLSDCQVNESRKWPISAKISIFFLACLTILIIIGTIVDVFERKRNQINVLHSNKGNDKNILNAFSVYSNLEILFENKKTDNSLDFLVGMKFWIIIWMLCLHIFVNETFWLYKRFRYLYNHMKYRNAGTIMVENSLMNTTYLMFLNGFVTTYALRNKESGQKVTERHKGILKSFFIKYMRLLPYIVFIMLVTFVIPLSYNGPIWSSTWKNMQENCLKNGWPNILLISNFYNIGEHCWWHMWFHSTIVQFQILCLPLLYVAKRNPKKSIMCGSVIFIGCFVRDFYVSIQNEYLFPVVHSMNSYELVNEFVSIIYLKPFHNFAPYAIGMIFGWINLKDVKMNKFTLCLCWGFYVPYSIALYYVVWFPTQNLILTALHNSLRNVFASLQIGWLTYTCLSGTAGIIGKFFSWKALRPLNKLLNSVTFFHPLLIMSYEAMRRERYDDSPVNYLKHTLALTAYSFLFAVIAFVMLESPFKRLCDIWEGKTFESCQKSAIMYSEDDISSSQSHLSVYKNEENKDLKKESFSKKDV